MNKNYQFFMKTNVDNYIGQWVAICSNKIVAHGKDVKKVFKEARERYPKERPFMARIPDKDTMIF